MTSIKPLPELADRTFIAAGKKPIKPTKPQALAGKKPPKFALEGNKWLIVGFVPCSIHPFIDERGALI